MGKRSRQRERDAGPAAGKPAAPVSDYVDGEGNVLRLRGAMTTATRREYAAVAAGGLHQEDAWQRAVEFLFERLAVSWTVAGVASERQRELLGRYRMASAEERRFVRESLRAHLAQWFPELRAP